jgi:hypothetical protein
VFKAHEIYLIPALKSQTDISVCLEKTGGIKCQAVTDIDNSSTRQNSAGSRFQAPSDELPPGTLNSILKPAGLK